MSRSNPYSLFTASPMSSPAPVSASALSPPTAAAVSSSSSPSAYDPFLDLGRLVSRLEHNLLRADSDRRRRLVSDAFQRQQARFDVAAARKLLARVEQSALPAKRLARRQELQTELSRRRALIEQLQERLDDLDEEARSVSAMRNGGLGGVDDDDDDEDDDETDEVDEELAHIQTPSRAAQPVEQPAEQPTEQPRDCEQRSGPAAPESPSVTPADKARRKKAGRVRIAAPAEAAGEVASAPATATRTAAAGARARKAASRRPARDTARDTAHTTSSEAAGGRRPASLFEKSTAGHGVVAEETILDHHRREQEELSGDILRLAQALKEKSMATARMLEDDKEVVDRVGDGMNTTTDSLTAASKSMALLSRMTEGKGWWGRMMLMAMVYGLMVLLVLLFLFLPKLRL